MRKLRRYVCTLVIILVPQIVLVAQELPTVAAYSLSSNDVGDNISKTVNDLVFSFVKELRNYRVVDMRAEALPRDLRVPDGTDYIFYGNLVSQNDGIKLELVLKGGPYAVTRLISRVYDNSNRILLESRMLVRDLFDTSLVLPEPTQPSMPESAPAGETVPKSSPETAESLEPVSNIDALAGSWHGEEGIEKVMILRGGRGVAVLSSGVSISLELLLSEGELVVRQKGANNPRQFSNLSDPVARQAVNVAPPLEWRFKLSADQQTLSGTKKTVIIKNDGKNILSMDNQILKVSWHRD